MNRTKTIAFFLFAVASLIATSCAILPHPNEKIIVGIWKPVKVERIVDSSALAAAVSNPADTVRKAPKGGRSGGLKDGARQGANAERLIQTELRTTLEIFANKTAVKKYPGKSVNFTWKLKSKGTRLVAKKVENKTKFVIEIQEISNDRIVTVNHVPAGDARITYERQK